MKFEAGKSYVTRDGREARVYATDGWGLWQIHGAIYEGHKGWICQSWLPNGRWSDAPQHGNDLMPPKREAWVNIYGDGHGYLHPSRRAADDWTDPKSRIACIKIEYTEGEGL